MEITLFAIFICLICFEIKLRSLHKKYDKIETTLEDKK